MARHYVPLAADLSNLMEVLQQLEKNETWAQTLAQAVWVLWRMGEFAYWMF